MLSHLQAELATFKARLPELLLHAEGQFAVIQGDEVAALLISYSDALEFGYGRFGLRPFLVKRVLAAEPVAYL